MDIRTMICGRRTAAKQVWTVAGAVAAAAVVAGVAVNMKSIKRYIKITFCM